LVVWVCMITRESISHGEGELVEGYPEIGSRKRTPQSENMASEEGVPQHKREFQRTFFAMPEIVKVLYDDYLGVKKTGSRGTFKERQK
jgi:hypothetical protein